MFSSHLFRAPCGVPVFLCWALLLICLPLQAADGIIRHRIEGGDFRSVHEAVVEVVEAEGMVIGQVLPFGQMLERTGQGQANPYVEAEIVQFCSAALARRLVLEDSGQMALCPLSIALYVSVAQPGVVVLAYRATGGESPARAQADELLARLVDRAARLGKLRW